MQDHVADTVGAVGSGSWPAAVAAGAELQFIALDAMSPCGDGYPCASPVEIGYLAEHREKVQPLINWLVSENGQAALRELDVLIS